MDGREGKGRGREGPEREGEREIRGEACDDWGKNVCVCLYARASADITKNRTDIYNVSIYIAMYVYAIDPLTFFKPR